MRNQVEILLSVINTTIHVLATRGGRQIRHSSEYSQYQEWVEPVVEKLEQIERYGHSRYDIFNDWVDLMLYSLQSDDENYLSIVNKYDNDQSNNQRPIDLYSQAFGELQHSLIETDGDLLGVIYEELGMNSDAFGQHFTPHNICNAKAEMMINIDDDREEPYTIADPACGSGRLLLSAAKRIPNGVDAVFYGQDKDSTCAKMTALNFYFFNLDGYAVHGDSLTMEKYRVWQAQRTMLGGKIRELDESEFPEINDEAIESRESAYSGTTDTADLVVETAADLDLID